MNSFFRRLSSWTVFSSSLQYILSRQQIIAAAMGVCLDSVEHTLQKVEQTFGTEIDIQTLSPQDREPVSITRNLVKRLPHVGCRCCWVRPAHCICDKLQSMEKKLPFERIFVLMHHKEVGLALDTAKLIFKTFPDTSRLVVGGIPGKFQDSMKEMEDALQQRSCVVLFPKEGAPLASSLFQKSQEDSFPRFPNLVVLDGTWEQARRLHARYIPEHTQHVQLYLDNTLDDEGRQLRRHPIPLREIATVHALQLLAEDLGVSLPLRDYQRMAKEAVKAHLGPIRFSPSYPNGPH